MDIISAEIRLLANFKTYKSCYGCLAACLFGGFGENLLHGLAVIFDERLLHKTVLGKEFLQFALDDFVDYILWFIFNLLGENCLLTLNRLGVDLILIQGQRLGCGDMHSYVTGCMLQFIR